MPRSWHCATSEIADGLPLSVEERFCIVTAEFDPQGRRDVFAERALRNIRRTTRYSGLMLAVRMTLAHFLVSLTRNFPNSAGELGGSTNPPRSRRRALMAAWEMAKVISLLSKSTTAKGVFFGAPNPSHEVAS
jgi:hypothetical protein